MPVSVVASQLAADGTLLLANQAGFVLAAELRGCGVDFSFTPVLDVDYGSSGVIGDRAFHSEPQAISELAHSLLQGLRQGGMHTVGKHFPGHGATEQDSHKTLPQISISTSELHATHLVPFRNAAALGIPAIMTAHIRYPALDARNPATLSRAVLSGLLKKDLGFKGLVVTDSLDMRAITSRIRVHKAAAAALPGDSAGTYVIGE